MDAGVLTVSRQPGLPMVWRLVTLLWPPVAAQPLPAPLIRLPEWPKTITPSFPSS